MMCEACLAVVVQIVTGLYRTIFSVAGYRLALNIYSYIKFYGCVELMVVCEARWCVVV